MKVPNLFVSAALAAAFTATLSAQQGIGVQQVASSGDETGLKLISAPVPGQEEVSLPRSEAIPFHSLEMAQNGGQSSSQDAIQTSAATSNPAITPAPKTKQPPHALGVALAILGTTALVAGVTLIYGEQHAYCNSSSTGCNEARDIGIALMPIGAGVAITGFYLRFHR